LLHGRPVPLAVGLDSVPCLLVTALVILHDQARAYLDAGQA